MHADASPHPIRRCPSYKRASGSCFRSRTDKSPRTSRFNMRASREISAGSCRLPASWLATNHYFVPAGTDAIVGPYIHAGAFFLALKLRAGQTAGDLQPVIVRYPSDLPMIPIVLTSVAAQPHMGVQVWMLGAGRAIPH